MLVDSHCHLNFPELQNDLEGVIERAAKNGVGIMVTINTRLSEAKELQAIAESHPQIYCTVGVHPHDAADYAGGLAKGAGEVPLPDQIKALATHPKVIGIGETGLDYYYTKSPQEDQISSFSDHIRASVDLSLPLVIHTREADEDTITCLKKAGKGEARGVFHCFSGSEDLSRQALDLGFYISFSGILTFKNAESLRQVAKNVPLDRILVETDSPFLAPIPHRGKPNEPAFTRYTAELLAELKGVTFEAIEEATTSNFFTLFSKVERHS